MGTTLSSDALRQAIMGFLWDRADSYEPPFRDDIRFALRLLKMKYPDIETPEGFTLGNKDEILAICKEAGISWPGRYFGKKKQSGST